MEDNSAYRDLFLEESDTHLEELNTGILQLEQTPEDLSVLDGIFRSAHTLKGMAATMGYESMTKLTHEMENVFDLFKKEVIHPEVNTISLIFDCLDTLSDIVEDLRQGGQGEVDVTDLVDRLDQVAGSSEKETESVRVQETTVDMCAPLHVPTMTQVDYQTIEAALQAHLNVYTIWSAVEKESMMKGVRAYFVLSKLEEIEAEILLAHPSGESLENGEFDHSFALIVATDKKAEEVRGNILSLNEIEDCQIEQWTEDNLRVPDSSVSSGSFDSLNQVEKENGAVKEPTTSEKETHSKSKTPARKPTNQAIRVPLDRLDALMDRVSELVIHRTRLEDISMNIDHADIHAPLEQVRNISTELQEIVLQLRMQPFSVVVQRFPRMIRDLSNSLGKEIEYVAEGEQTELDRSIVSQIGDPLVHLLRNAADHGIESPEERVAAGKPPHGTIKISAYSEGNRVVITVSDDGKGLNPANIKASAERKGISTEGLSDKEIQNLVFHPGFSTIDAVTAISGRGVGMDVVKQNIHALSGTIETDSVVGVGTTFRITLPLTLSIIDALIVQARDQHFAMPQSVIEKIEKYSPSQHVQVHQQEVYNYQGNMLPVTSLQQSLGLSNTTNGTTHVVVVLLGDEYHAVLVEGIIGQREIVIKELGKELAKMEKLIGATILGSGELLLILDVTAICTEKKRNELRV